MFPKTHSIAFLIFIFASCSTVNIVATDRDETFPADKQEFRRAKQKDFPAEYINTTSENLIQAGGPEEELLIDESETDKTSAENTVANIQDEFPEDTKKPELPPDQIKELKSESILEKPVIWDEYVDCEFCFETEKDRAWSFPEILDIQLSDEQYKPITELGDYSSDPILRTLDLKTSGWKIVIPSAEIIGETPDIKLYTNKRIKAFIRMYTHRKRDVFEKAIIRSAKYMKMIHRIFREYDLPLNLAYLAVVESNFNPEARSPANAVGLWQFMSYTGKIFNLNRSWWHDERYDPEKSTVAAAKYLKHLYQKFNNNWELALAAYNSGSGTVRRAIRKAKARNKPFGYWDLKLPRETRGYVPAFFAVARLFENLAAYGFQPAPAWEEEVPKQVLSVAGGLSLKQISQAIDFDHQVLASLNPSLRLGGLTPATGDFYNISLPHDFKIEQSHMVALEELKKYRYKFWKFHKVRQGETLWEISRHYRIPIKKIKTFNHIRRNNLITIGQKLLLPVPASWTPPVKRSKIKQVKKNLDKLPGITIVHKVIKGDTLWKISQKYQIPISTIRRWNSFVLRKRILKIGSEIILKLAG